ncbi:hypothetical protein [Bacillus thuringiensis]|uniref:hypothetical protein n=1 Tax=Bacillus thuringiensis TaxID=1428 RepID=UPI0015CF7A2E|nr:hypothetical protein [Bacillus thuringiensis]
MGISSYNPVIIPISIYEEWVAQQKLHVHDPIPYFLNLTKLHQILLHMVDIQIEDAIHQLLFVYQLFRRVATTALP